MGCATLAALALVGGRAEASAPLRLGLVAFGPLSSSSPSVRSPWIDRAVSEGASIVRVGVTWSAVAPSSLPSGFRQSDPGSRFYSWTQTDATVRALAAKRLSILMLLEGAPSWAEGPHRPRNAPPGSWRPDPRAFGRFARAAAMRYSGHYPDPLNPGHYLPRVRHWEAWNEANLWLYLTPQWIRPKGHWVAESPVLYRGLLDAMYDAVKGVSRANVVVSGGTAPFGDPQPGQRRIPPVDFVRGLLCLKGSRLSSGHCRQRAKFDVLDHHPFDVGSPLQHAANPGDVSVPDMGKLTRLLRAARRAGTLFPRAAKRVWVTELIWASRPPDPGGIPILRHGRWLEQALYVLRHEGVDTVFWLQIVDEPGANGLDGGLYFANGKPKPAATAFRFAFVTVRQNSRTIRAWGRAPVSGTLTLQRQSGHRWVTMKRLSVQRSATFSVQLRLPQAATLRARLGRLTSLTWPQR